MEKSIVRKIGKQNFIYPSHRGMWDFGFCCSDCSVILTFHKAILAKNFSNFNRDFSLYANPFNFQNAIISFLRSLSDKQISRLPVETSLRPSFFEFRQNVIFPQGCICDFVFDISEREKFALFDRNKFFYRVKFVK